MGSVPCDKKRLYIHTLHRPSAKKLNFLLIVHKQKDKQELIRVQLTYMIRNTGSGISLQSYNRDSNISKSFGVIGRLISLS